MEEERIATSAQGTSGSSEITDFGCHRAALLAMTCRLRQLMQLSKILCHSETGVPGKARRAFLGWATRTPGCSRRRHTPP